MHGWREVFQQGEFPFYFVQLASYRYPNVPFALAEIRESQLRCITQIPHAGMAVTVDISDLKDIHSKNKQDVGKRLALWALAKDYGFKDLVYSGPLYDRFEVQGNAIRIHFKPVGKDRGNRGNRGNRGGGGESRWCPAFLVYHCR